MFLRNACLYHDEVQNKGPFMTFLDWEKKKSSTHLPFKSPFGFQGQRLSFLNPFRQLESNTDQKIDDGKHWEDYVRNVP